MPSRQPGRSAALLLVLWCVVGLTPVALAQTAPATQPRAAGAQSAGNPDPNSPRPIDAVDSVFLEELTWMEVRDALRDGKTTAIVATGGIEQNGPYLALGKHNYVLRATTEAIARKLGNALVAPVVAFVPEGGIDPPSGHMRYPGTISLTDSTYRALLTDIVSSLKAHGFSHIVLLGDSGGNQTGMKDVAQVLNAKWNGRPGVHFIPEYYDYAGAATFARNELGIREVSEGLHDDFVITSIMMTVDPRHVRLAEREAKGKASINGVSITPASKAIAAGRRLVEYRADITVSAIRKAIGAPSASGGADDTTRGSVR